MLEYSDMFDMKLEEQVLHTLGRSIRLRTEDVLDLLRGTAQSTPLVRFWESFVVPSSFLRPFARSESDESRNSRDATGLTRHRIRTWYRSDPR